MKGKELIKNHIDNIPQSPGIYKMLDSNEKIIYIGKAKNLRNRIIQYTLSLNLKNEIMVSHISNIDFIITESESDALLLEGQLIRKFKPQYNILLKDDKSFPFIKLRLDHQYPQLVKFRGKNFKNGKFFGPFASPKHVDVTLKEMQKIFKLRPCSDQYFSSRTRPCLQYQIERCNAPCVNKISSSDYMDLVEEVKSFLSGKNKKLQESLSKKMENFSKNLEFEKAAEVRDRIKAISYVQLKSLNYNSIKDADVIAAASNNGEFCIEVFIYRNYQSCGNQSYFFSDIDSDKPVGKLIGAFIMQLYQNKVPASKIFVSHEFENYEIYEKALKKMHNVNVKISNPKFSAPLKIISNAIYNAKAFLEKKLKISAKNSKILDKIQKIFFLKNQIKRIEIYDNSHIQGAFPVGAMVVSGINGFEKKEYRLFNIKTIPDKIGDDYAMLKEVLTRRLKRLKIEPAKTPDLMIIDGGKGHMKTTLSVMKDLKINIPFVCMSKGVERNSGNEQFHIPGNDAFTLDKTSEIMKYLQILRDEAHNFVIKSHRNKRSKSIRVSSLDNIQGIGEARKKALLDYFGSFKMISDATEKELTKVKGISKELAKSIYNNLS